jgi:hypothetical protein
MTIYLTPQQFEPLYDFCLGIAKGLMLAAFIGQGFVKEYSGLLRLAFSLAWVTGALFFLAFAVLFKKEVKQ